MNTPLIPRKALFGNPDKTDVRISPDGATLAWLAPWEGVMNLWVAPRARLAEARSVTTDRGRGIHAYRWTYLPGVLLYQQDTDGDENWHLHRLDLATGAACDLTPFALTSASVVSLSPRRPSTLIVGLNRRRPEWHDLYRLDLATGELTLLLENDEFAGFEVDWDDQIRLALRPLPDGGFEGLRPAASGWVASFVIRTEDAMNTQTLGFAAEGRELYLLDSRDRDTAALVSLNLETGQRRVLAADETSDAESVLRHPATGALQAVCFHHERRRWSVLAPEFEPHYAALQAQEGDWEVLSRSLDDRWWTVTYHRDVEPETYLLYDAQTRSFTRLFGSNAALEGAPLAPMRSAVISARDGLPLVCYYTLPQGAARPAPLVLVPHGGPWWRDSWGPNTLHRWLADRGYVALSVNFRASTGFGKAFLNAGNKEWGGKVLEDQLDAVQWVVDQGHADPKRLGVLGGSFGGYSTLALLAFHPEVFSCGVDLVGPSNLVTLLESVPDYWKPTLTMMTTRIGDHRTEEGRALLARHSPLSKAHQIRVPLLIGQGANDPRVKQAESDQIVDALRKNGIPVTYLLYPNEGHGFARPESNLSFFGAAEVFLAENLGGRCEALERD